ncbi:MAG: response regulator transcription factor [Candidatus Azobacteroides sp.]|nr:response regulator transcription factor [Candidatus Azobacteroides sp.]
MDKKKILIVDDEADIREILEFNLKSEGFDVDTAESAEEALKIFSPDYRLIILDVMMGGMSGFRMAEKLRKDGILIPIIYLTAKNTENDMLTGFSTGGDDYIVKPFSIKEVSARIKAVLKRTEIRKSEEKKSVLILNKLVVDSELKQVTIHDKPVVLTKKEFEILYLLMKNPSRVYTREEILNKIWKDNGYVLDRTVDVHITRLRKKLGNYGHYIVNRPGFGYCFDENKNAHPVDS